MKRYTMLEMVQEIGRSIAADEITLMDESVEAQDIVHIAVAALESMATRREWYWRQHKVRQMTAGTGDDRTTLVLPVDVDGIEKVQYRSDVAGSNQATFAELTFLTPDQFLPLVRSRDLSNPIVDTITIGVDSVPIYVYNDRPPRYYTQFDEGAIVCDAYDTAVNPTGLTAVRSMLVATVNIDTTPARTTPTWVAPIPTRFFPLWLAEATASASVQLRQMQHPIAERDARRLLIDLTEFNEQVISDRFNKGVNYGRRYGY